MNTVDLDPDAPHSPARTRALADLAADTARTLNYATMPGRGGLTYPGDVYELLGALAQTAQRLPQLCNQIRDWLVAEQNASHLAERPDGPNEGSSALAVMRAIDGLTLAAGRAEEVRDGLKQAQASIRAVEYVGPAIGEQDEAE